MKDFELRTIDHEVEMDCTTIARRADYILTAYKDGNFEKVKSLLSSLNLWVNSLNDAIFNRIFFTPKDVEKEDK
jgi:hypothetical protein